MPAPGSPFGLWHSPPPRPEGTRPAVSQTTCAKQLTSASPNCLSLTIFAAAPLIAAAERERVLEEVRAGAGEIGGIMSAAIRYAERERIRSIIGPSSSRCSRGVHVPWSVIERALEGDGNG
jgi:hypothetical protein